MHTYILRYGFDITLRAHRLVARELDAMHVGADYAVAQNTHTKPMDWEKNVKGDARSVRAIDGQKQVDHYDEAVHQRLDALRREIALGSSTKGDAMHARVADVMGVAEGDLIRDAAGVLDKGQLDVAMITQVSNIISQGLNVSDLGEVRSGDTLQSLVGRAVRWGNKEKRLPFGELMMQSPIFANGKNAELLKNPKFIASLQLLARQIMIDRAVKEGFNVDYLVPGMKLEIKNGALAVVDAAKRQSHAGENTLEGKFEKKMGSLTKAAEQSADAAGKAQSELATAIDTHQKAGEVVARAQTSLDTLKAQKTSAEQEKAAAEGKKAALDAKSPAYAADLAAIDARINQAVAEIDEATKNIPSAEAALNAAKSIEATAKAARARAESTSQSATAEAAGQQGFLNTLKSVASRFKLPFSN